MATFVALDVETANESRSSICSIGLVKFSNNKIEDRFYSLINPEEYFDDFNIMIHGIRPGDVKDAPTFPQILPEILDFIGGLPIVAHFAQFDIGALKDVLDKYKIEYPDISYFCSYFISKAAIPGLLNYKLNSLSDHFRIELDHHNALSDATASGQIIVHLIEQSGNPPLEEFLKGLLYRKLGKLGEYGFKRRKDRKQADIFSDLPELTPEEFAKLDQEHACYGEHFVFTGKLERFTRKEAATAVIKLGGIPEKNVTQRTNILVVGEQDWKVVGEDGLSTKMKKAQELLSKGQEIEILTENDFLKILSE